MGWKGKGEWEMGEPDTLLLSRLFEGPWFLLCPGCLGKLEGSSVPSLCNEAFSQDWVLSHSSLVSWHGWILSAIKARHDCYSAAPHLEYHEYD